MTVDQAIDQLIKDLNAFKQSVRNGDEESQNNSLKLLDEVIASDRNLQQSFSKYSELQQTIKRVQEKEAKLRDLDGEIAGFAKQVYEQICLLESSIDSDAELLQKLNNQLANIDHLDKQTVLRVAKELSATKGPSRMWKPDQSLGIHRPPYPTEDLMRCSLIFQRMNLGKGHDSQTREEIPDASKIKVTESSRQRNEMHVMQENDFDLLGLDLNPDLI